MTFALRALVPELRPYAEWLVRAIEESGYRVRITSVVRDPEKQAQLYANRGRNPYPVAPPGCSQHEYGLAWDMVTEPYDVLFSASHVWQHLGGSWGGERDPIHFSVYWSRPPGCG